MSYKVRRFMEGDQVTYCGDSARQELGGKIGVVHSAVTNCDDEYVIEFPDTKHEDSYVIHESSLKKYVPSDKNNNGPSVASRRRKRDEDNEEERKGK